MIRGTFDIFLVMRRPVIFLKSCVALVTQGLAWNKGYVLQLRL